MVSERQTWSIDDALDAVRRQFPGIVIARAEKLGGGIEFQVYRVFLDDQESFVAKFPNERWVFNDNDRGLDSFQLLGQERFLLGFSRENGIPAPSVKAILTPDDGPHILLLEFVATDGIAVDDFALGRIAKRLHGLPPPDIDLVAQRGRAASEVVAELTAERVAVVAGLAGPLGPVPDARRLQHLLAPIDRQPRLLHMDLRPANYLCADGQLLGLIDWSNALKADPLLELARVEEYGGLSGDFAAGYGLDPLQRAELEGPTGLCCRLYTAAMLAVVFLCEAPDPAPAAVRVERLKALLAKLAASAG